MILMITSVIRNDTANKAFGFATDDEGLEYFLPRAVIIRNDITTDDIGADITAEVRENPTPIKGKSNLPHVTKLKFEGEDA